MATIVMESAKVRVAAQDVIDRIYKAREDKRREYLNAYCSIQKFSFRKMRKVYAYTMAEAQEYADMNMREWGNFAYGYQLKQAKALLLLAQHGDPVTLNSEDVDTLFG